jgi:hypothetical protein
LDSVNGGITQYQPVGNHSVILNFPTWLRDELSPKAIRDNSFSTHSLNASNSPRDLHFSRKFADQVLSERCTLIKNTPEGRRNQSLIRHATYIGKIIGMGSLDEKVAIERLLEAAVSSGLTKYESLNAIRSGIKYGKNLVGQ